MVLVISILGVFAVLAGFWLRLMSRRAMTWPETQGEIIQSELSSDPHDAGSMARIGYSYHVDGHRYESNQVSYTARSASAAANRAVVDRYPKGSRVTVYYDPHAPRRAVIERGTNRLWIGIVITGLIFIVIAEALRRL